MTGIIQGRNAVLSLYNGAWLPFVCATSVTLNMASEDIAIRTPGAGHWKKTTYGLISYSLTLSGTLMYDLSNWTGFDFNANLLNFSDMRFRLAMTDDQGDIQSFQGYIKLSSQSVSYAPGQIVKTSISLTGNGELQSFAGLIACPSSITGISVAGQTGGSGTVTITYTYTGAPYQVKYRLDGIGNYIYSLVGTALVIPSLAAGSHSVEIVPVCQNGYEADSSTSQAFIVTYGMTCSAVCTGITVTSTTATPTFTGSPANYKYSIDSAAWVYVAASFVVPVGGLAVGAHSITIVPVCANAVEGTGATQGFTVSSQPSQSVISYNFADWKTGDVFQVYVNGILNISLTGASSGSITVPTGAIIRGSMTNNNALSFATLTTTDTTTSTVLDSRTLSYITGTLQYVFTANGDAFTIHGTLTP